MKKSLKTLAAILLLALPLSLTPVTAQVFDEGDLVISAGFGLGATYYTFGTYYKTTVPPVFLAGDYCLREDLGPGNLGVGGIIAYSAYKYEPSFVDWGWKYTTLIIGARGSYHFTDLVDKLDLYGGIVLGAKIVSDKSFGEYPGYGYSTNSSGVVYDMFAGARYFFADNFGVMGELGYGIAWLKIGVSLKF